MGTLYYGDNLDILRRYLKDETVDLVYLDPPFNSAQNYNAFFHEKDGTDAASQIRAFEDTWSWNEESQRVYQELTLQPGKVSEVLQAFRTFLGHNDMMAYLAMMAPRLIEVRRVLKSTGSLYLHCDPTASHYLKLPCDAVFGVNAFVNEITWLRSGRRSSISRIFRRAHDVILFYGKADDYRFNLLYEEKGETLLKKYSLEDDRGKYRLVPLMASGKRGGITGKPWRGFDPNVRGIAGMHWITVHEHLEEYAASGLVAWPQKPDGVPQLKYYLDENKGVPLPDIWTDIDVINSMAQEALGYPTQKPLALLERIISASSNPGDLVLDPFCGCGTTIDAAEKLGRKWIGIDITQLAVTLIKNRLLNTYEGRLKFVTASQQDAMVGRAVPSAPCPPGDAEATAGVSIVRIIGEPVTPNEAATLAEQDKYQFQWWALGLVGARPVEQKKGADHGIDGKVLFRDDPRAAKPEQIIIQVKGGKTGVKDVRDLRGVLDRERAAIGVLISLQPPTKEMVAEAVSTGFYVHKTNAQQYPKLQLRTVKELIDGRGIERPSNIAATDETFKKAPKAKGKGHEQTAMDI